MSIRIVDADGNPVVDTGQLPRVTPLTYREPVKGACFRKAAIGPEPFWLTRQLKSAWQSAAMLQMKKWCVRLLLAMMLVAIIAVIVMPTDVVEPLREHMVQYLP